MNIELTKNMSIIMMFSVVLLGVVPLYVIKKEKHKKIFLVIFVIFISIISGLRGPNVGRDTHHYYSNIDLAIKLNYNRYSTEPGLFFISKLSSILIEDVNFTLITISFIINGLFVLRLQKLKEKYNFDFNTSFSLYLLMVFLPSLSGIRQWLALSVIFYFGIYLIEEKYIKYSLGVFLAFLFHNTAIIALLPILVLQIVRYRQELLIKMRKIRSNKIILFTIIFISIILLTLINSLISKKYYIYFSNFVFLKGIGLTLFIKVAILVLIIKEYLKSNFTNSLLLNNIIIVIMGLLLSIPGYYLLNLNRISLYLTIFEIYFIGFLLPIQNKKIINLLIILICFYFVLFGADVIFNGRGTLPYVFNFTKI